MGFEPIADAARRAAADFRDLAAARIGIAMGRVVDDARSGWPDDSGKSAASLRTVGAGVASDLRYTDRIHGGETWRALVVEPVEQSAGPIAQAIARDAVAPFQGV